MDNKENVFFTPFVEDMLREGKTVQISLSGLSMFPFLMHGDIVLITSVTDKNLYKGAIVVFKINDRWIAHRLIKVDANNNLLYTRGDGKSIKDKPVKIEQIKGIVVKIVKSRWKLANFSIGKPAKIIAFLSPVTAPIFNFIIWGAGKVRK